MELGFSSSRKDSGALILSTVNDAPNPIQINVTGHHIPLPVPVMHPPAKRKKIRENTKMNNKIKYEVVQDNAVQLVRKEKWKNKKPRTLPLCAFPSFDKSDSLIFFPTTFIKHRNCHDFHEMYKLFRRCLAKDCQASFPFGKFPGHPLLLTRVLQIVAKAFPDTCLLAESTRVEGNIVTAKIFNKFTDAIGLIKTTRGAHSPSPGSSFSGACTGRDVGTGNGCNGKLSKVHARSDADADTGDSSMDSSNASSSSSFGGGGDSACSITSGISTVIESQQQQQQQQQQDDTVKVNGTKSEDDDEVIGNNRNAFKYASTELTNTRAERLLPKIDMASKTPDEIEEILALIHCPEDIDVHVAGAISIAFDNRSQLINNFSFNFGIVRLSRKK
mmetsp:Transcript_19268/g.32260  ORF Transcript_19268/g.32260 Transcript_19268/m.32260 type:complete len:388 (+) Transcript_19268:143-1306(+)